MVKLLFETGVLLMAEAEKSPNTKERLLDVLRRYATGAVRRRLLRETGVLAKWS